MSFEIYFNKETRGWVLKNGENFLELNEDEFENIRGKFLPFYLERMKRQAKKEASEVAR